MSKHEHLIKAFEDGKRIQYRIGSIYGPLTDDWEIVDAPQWHQDGEYRIHPDDSKRHVHYNEIIAWANGEQIQYQSGSPYGENYGWVDEPNPTWAPNGIFRIKPATVTYRLALMYSTSTGTHYVYSCTIFNANSLEEFEKESVHFIKWISDVQSVEI